MGLFDNTRPGEDHAEEFPEEEDLAWQSELPQFSKKDTVVLVHCHKCAIEFTISAKDEFGCKKCGNQILEVLE